MHHELRIRYELMFLIGFVFIFLITRISHTVSVQSFQIVNSNAAFSSSNKLDEFFSTLNFNSEKLVSFVDCTSERGNDLINKIFSTSFPNEAGVYVEATDECPILFSTFEGLFSAKFCGCKAVDYCNYLPGKLALVVQSQCLESVLAGYDQILRRILRKSNANTKKELIFIVDVTGDAEATINESIVKEKIAQTVEKVWNENNKENLLDSIELKVIFVDYESLTQLEENKKIRAFFSQISTDGTELTTEKNFLTSKFLSEKWLKVNPVEEPVAVLSPVERESIFAIEMAFSGGLAHAEVIINQWQSRVANGNIVGKFSERVNSLLKSLKTDFNKRTAGSLMLREKNDRLKKIINYVRTIATSIFRQQLSILETRTINKFRKTLIQIAASSPPAEKDKAEDPSLNRGKEQQALRDAVFDFKASVADLESEELGFSSAETILLLTESLETILKEFPESAAYKLEEIKKLIKETKKPKPKKKKSRAFNIALNLVGMLRPPGFGNLQGFIGYATKIYTKYQDIPLDLMLGFQNDGDSPEIMGEDREYSLLRVQPKINFDLDL